MTDQGPDPGNALWPYLQAVAGGPRTARSLSREEAREAARAVMEGKWHPATLGAFLLALRWKGETAEELAGLLEGLRAGLEGGDATAAPGPERAGPVLDASGAYDGREETVPLGLAAAFIAAAAGQPIFLHGTSGVPVKAGVTPGHVLAALGIEPASSPAEAREQINRVGLAYLDQSVFHPQLHHLLPLRWAVGKRTFLNTLEPHLNPLGASGHLGSVFHPPMAEKVALALALAAPFRRVVVIAGEEGGTDPRPGGTLVAEWEKGMEKPHTWTLRLRERGWDWTAPRFAGERLADRVAEAARLTERVLSGEELELARGAVAGAALHLYAAGKETDLDSALAQARSALEGGKAREILERWRSRAPSSP